MDLRHHHTKDHAEVSDCTPEDASHGEYRNGRYEGLDTLLRARRLGDKVFHDILWFNSQALGRSLWPTRCVFRDVQAHNFRKAARFVACGFERVRFTGRLGPIEVHPISITESHYRDEERSNHAAFCEATDDFAIDLTEAELDCTALIIGLDHGLLRGRPDRDAYIGPTELAALTLPEVPGNLLDIGLSRARSMGHYGCTLHAIGESADAVRALVADGRARWLNPS